MAKSQGFDTGKRQDQGVNVASMISAPLVAASKANSEMLKHQAHFLMEFCFIKKEIKDADGNVTGNNYEPLMIEMNMTKSVINHDKSKPVFETERVTFKVPVLTLIPINSLAVDDIQIDFDMEIISQTSRKTNASEMGESQSGTKETAELRGKISYDSKESSNSSRRSASKLKVKVHAGPLPLPVGVSAMIDMYSKAIHPVPEKESSNSDPK